MIPRCKNINEPFRQAVGFSQDIYSLYLGISKGLLSLVEPGLRSLSGASDLKHGELYLRWLNFEKTWQPPAITESEIAITGKYLTKMLDNLKFQQQSKSRKQKISETDIDFQKASSFLEMELAQN
jgi:hypothetical protein